MDFEESLPGVGGADFGRVEAEFFFGEFLELGNRFFGELGRGAFALEGAFAHAEDVFTDVCLVGPVVDVLGEEHVSVVFFVHFGSEDGLGDGVADGVACGVPAVVGGDAVEEVVLFDEFH